MHKAKTAVEKIGVLVRKPMKNKITFLAYRENRSTVLRGSVRRGSKEIGYELVCVGPDPTIAESEAVKRIIAQKLRDA